MDEAICLHYFTVVKNDPTISVNWQGYIISIQDARGLCLSAVLKREEPSLYIAIETFFFYVGPKTLQPYCCGIEEHYCNINYPQQKPYSAVCQINHKNKNKLPLTFCFQLKIYFSKFPMHTILLIDCGVYFKSKKVLKNILIH